jgi:hypothetical protein
LAAMGVGDSPEAVLRAEVVNWVAGNNAFGPDHPIGEDMGKIADAFLQKQENFSILIGPGLTASGKATRVGMYCRQFFTVEYPDALAKKSGLQPNNVVQIPEPGRALRRDPPALELGKPAFAQLGPWRIDQPITGTAGVRKLVPRLGAGDYSLRLTYAAGNTQIQCYHDLGNYITPRAEKEGLKFKFATEAAVGGHSGPTLVFLDLIDTTPAAADDFGGAQVEVLSKTIVMLVDVAPGKK